MPRFFFNIRQHEHTLVDDEGEELDALQAAYDRAIVAAREIMAVMTSKGLDAGDGEIAILDASKQSLLVVHFRDVVPPV